MDAVMRHSTSPDCSDSNEPTSAPSEFLAEFLSAIMRRQYAEALKYCRLILQYEPHNATARGFYPLLQHKLNNGNAEEMSSTSEEAIPSPNLKNAVGDSSSSGQASRSGESGSLGGSGSSGGLGGSGEMGEESSGDGEPWEESERSGASCSSLELDTSSPAERRGDTSRSDHSDRSTDSAWSRWESSRSSRSERDDNGNAPAAPPSPPALPSPPAPDTQCFYTEGDIENDNAAGDAYTTLDTPTTRTSPTTLRGGAATSLRRLRSQFACSIK